MKLFRYGRSVGTMFDLLGRREDDMTYALGYVMSRSPSFAEEVVRALGATLPGVEGVVRLQTAHDHGRTDVELEVGEGFCLVFEAKRGPDLPSVEQLRRYARRMTAKPRDFARLVAVTNAPPEFARPRSPPASTASRSRTSRGARCGGSCGARRLARRTTTSGYSKSSTLT